MNNDLDVIVKTFPKTWDRIHLYALGDIHVGSEQFDEASVRKKVRIIQDDPIAVVSLCGDLGDYGLKNSKTNVYQATMQPKEQQEYIYELFNPIKEKIVSAVPGNHEERLVKEVGICPLYDLCVRWGVQDVYRENVAILKLMFGSRAGKKTTSQLNTFIGITTHGTTRNKHKKFLGGFDGIDFAISGHTHTPEYSPHGKIRVNGNAATAKHVAYKEIVVDANLRPGGYSLKHEYEIAPPPEIQYLEMYIKRGPAPQREETKVINYHAIQI